MRFRLFTWVLLVASVLCYWGSAYAEPSSDPPKESSTPILDRLDNLGKRLFGSPKPSDRDRPANTRSSSKPSSSDEISLGRSSDRVHVPRSGSVSGTTVRRDDAPAARRDSELFGPRREPEQPAGRRGATPGAAREDIEPSPSRRSVEPLMPRGDLEPSAARSLNDRPAGVSGKSRAEEPPQTSPRAESTETPLPPPQPEKPVPPVPGLIPIHERLGAFRESLFSKPGESAEKADGAKNASAANPGKSESAASEPTSRESTPSPSEAEPSASTPKRLEGQSLVNDLAIPRATVDNPPAVRKEADPPLSSTRAW